MTLAATTAAFTFALVFARSGTSKLRHIDSFETLLRDYGALPGSMTRPLARIVGPYELIVSALLVAQPTRIYGLVLGGVFLASAAVVIAVSLALDRVPSKCGCFDMSSSTPPTWSHAGFAGRGRRRCGRRLRLRPRTSCAGVGDIYVCRLPGVIGTIQGRGQPLNSPRRSSKIARNACEVRSRAWVATRSCTGVDGCS
jgi:hypothetical protein